MIGSLPQFGDATGAVGFSRFVTRPEPLAARSSVRQMRHGKGDHGFGGGFRRQVVFGMVQLIQTDQRFDLNPPDGGGVIAVGAAFVIDALAVETVVQDAVGKTADELIDGRVFQADQPRGTSDEPGSLNLMSVGTW